jgi:lipopolysaccharide export system protein LptA
VKKLILLFLLFPFSLWAYETVVESDEVHYDGEWITLTGNVIVENAMGKVTAHSAVLKKDSERKTKIDFPWIDLKHNVCLTLADGGVLKCETLFFDYTKMTSLFYGSPQVSYLSSLGEVYADRAQVDYKEINGSFEATKVTLFDNVRLVNLGSSEKPSCQYALADEVSYFPQEQTMILEGKNNPVLFYDKLHDMQLSARTVHARRDCQTKKETVQGIGDVRFVFGPEELEKIKQRFVFR